MTRQPFGPFIVLALSGYLTVRQWLLTGHVDRSNSTGIHTVPKEQARIGIGCFAVSSPCLTITGTTVTVSVRRFHDLPRSGDPGHSHGIGPPGG